jgi:hypothetical protein
MVNRFVQLVVLFIGLLLAGPADAQQKLVIAVGNNLGFDDEEPLHYAQKDAKRFARLLTDLGDARPERVFLLLGQDPHKLEQVIGEAKGRAAELRNQGHDVMLIFYYAGHGESQALHLGPKRLPLERLQALLDEVPANVRILLIDSCQSSGGSRSRGVVRAAPFDIQVQTNPLSGVVTVTSASPGEPAQESDQLGGAVFSHYLLSGLRGPADRDGDRQVTLQEAYDFAYSRTLLRTATTRQGTQHPSFDVDLEGSGPVVLTRTQRASVLLQFLPEADIRYLVYSLPSRSILAEVPARPDRKVSLALPPGRFLVQRRGPDGHGITQVDLPWGGADTIRPEQFTNVEFQQLAVRGGRIELHNWMFSADYSTEVLVTEGARWAHGSNLSIGYAFGNLLAELRLAVLYASLAYLRYTGSELRLGVRPTLSYGFGNHRYTARFGLGLSIEPTWQFLDHLEAERLKAAGMRYEEYFTSTGLGPHFVANLSIALFAFTTAHLELSYTPLWIHTWTENDDKELTMRHALGLNIGLGYAF